VKKAAILILFAAAALAKEPPKPDETAAVKIELATAKAQTAYYKAQWADALSKYFASLAELNRRDSASLGATVSCGEYDLKNDPQSGLPSCVAKPAKEEKAK